MPAYGNDQMAHETTKLTPTLRRFQRERYASH